MKRLFTLLLIAFSVLSCEVIDEKLDDLLNKRDWVVFADGTELTVDVPSKQTVLNYKFESTLDWELTTESKWLEIDPTSGKAGKDIKIQIKVLHNKDKEGRTGYVDLTLSNEESYRITVNQAGEGEENDDIIVDIPNNEIWYTTTNGEVVEPYSGEENNNAEAFTTFGANIISNTYIDGKGVITFDGDVATIGDWAFYGFTSLTSITIPNSVTTIGDYTFASCNDIQNIYFGDNVQSFGEYSFHDCYALTSIYIPYGITSLDLRVLAGCRSLTEVNIPSSVTVINDSAIAGCWELKSVNIPDSVTSIGESAFHSCESLTSVTIGNSVTSIGDFAFAGCTSLTSVTIPDSVTELGYAAFTGCTSLTSVTIGNSVTEIGYRAFNYCTSLTSVTIPDSITSIGEWVFGYCTSLASVTIPGSVTEIGDHAFYNCESLTSVTIPDSVTSIGDSAFADCYSLTSFYGKFTSVDNRCLIANGKLIAFAIGCGATEYTIPDSVTTIGDSAFRSCYSLTNITIPDSVTEIRYMAFAYCHSLKEVYCKPTTPPTGDYNMFDNNASGRKIYVPAESYYDYICAEGWRDYADSIVGEGDIDIPNNEIWYTSTDGEIVKPYSEESNNNADALTTFGANIVSNTYVDGKGVIEFDGDVTEIGEWAFGYCTSLASVTIPGSVTEIGGAAFADCTSLTSVTIPDSVTEIGDSAFVGCTSLTNITIPDSVTEIRYKAFCYCYSLTNITIPDSVTKIGEGAFCECTSLTSITIPDSVTSIGVLAFYDCTSLTSFYGKLASVDNRCLIVNGELVAFAPAGLTAYTIPDSVTAIGGDAFSSCESLTSVTIPDSVTSIGGYAFFNCSSLTSVIIPDSVTLIGNDAFYNCTSLTSVTIPGSVSSIGNYAFYNCESLTSVYCEPTTPPTGEGYNKFDNNASGRKIYVPMESVEAYKSARYWKDYANAIVGYDFE